MCSNACNSFLGVGWCRGGEVPRGNEVIFRPCCDIMEERAWGDLDPELLGAQNRLEKWLSGMILRRLMLLGGRGWLGDSAGIFQLYSMTF